MMMFRIIRSWSSSRPIGPKESVYAPGRNAERQVAHSRVLGVALGDSHYVDCVFGHVVGCEATEEKNIRRNNMPVSETLVIAILFLQQRLCTHRSVTRALPRTWR